MRDVLLTAMDRVQNAILDHCGADVVAPLLDDLARLCAEHFATEERVLRRYGYQHVDARSAMHARLLKRIPDLQRRIRSGSGKGPGITRFLHSLSQQAGYRESSAA
jgi:hemerythrin-like metal-binding protein